MTELTMVFELNELLHMCEDGRFRHLHHMLLSFKKTRAFEWMKSRLENFLILRIFELKIIECVCTFIGPRCYNALACRMQQPMIIKLLQGNIRVLVIRFFWEAFVMGK